MGLQEQHWYMDIIRYIFGLLDSLVYGLIKWIMYGIFDLSSLSTNSDVFNGIYSRIYVILGIFMAFKLSFSFFQYIIQPDSMGAKSEKGVSKLFMRVFLMLFALIALPSILFGQNGQKGLLQRSQDAFLPMLPRVLFGTKDFGNTSTAGGVTATVEQSSEEIAVETLKGFFHPPEDLDTVCKAGTLANTPELEHLDEFLPNINITCTSSGTGLLGTNIAATKYYKYSYTLFISTVVGVLEAALLLAITLDIAKRIFKLIILEVLAPIPIMSLIDPKGSKDGAFSKWVHSLTSTFIDIFIKLGLVYLIVVLIHMIVNANEKGGIFINYPSFSQNGFRAVYLTILLILGLIFFAKEAPKFIKDALGIKDNGGGLFDDVKTLGKAAGIVGAGAIGIAGRVGAGYQASSLSDETNGKAHTPLRRMKNIGAGLLGGIGGVGTTIKAAGAKDASFGSIMKANQQRNQNLIAKGASGSTWFGRRGSELSSFFRGESPASRWERTVSGEEARASTGKALHEYLLDRGVKKASHAGVSANYRGAAVATTYDDFNSAYENAKASHTTSFTVAGQTFDTYSSDTAAFEGDLKTAAAEHWLTHNSSTDTPFNTLFQAYQDAGGNFRGPVGKRVDNLKTDYKSNQNQAVVDKGRLRRAKANDKYSASKK